MDYFYLIKAIYKHYHKISINFICQGINYTKKKNLIYNKKFVDNNILFNIALKHK